jgi:hypothetical protein
MYGVDYYRLEVETMVYTKEVEAAVGALPTAAWEATSPNASTKEGIIFLSCPY